VERCRKSECVNFAFGFVWNFSKTKTWCHCFFWQIKIWISNFPNYCRWILGQLGSRE
jgi:hypothetical protein